MIAVVLPLDSATAAAVAIASPGALPAADLHCTLAVIDGDHPDVAALAAKIVGRVASLSSVVPATLSGVGRFSGSTADAFHLTVDSTALAALNAWVRDELRWGGVPVRQEHGFDPHVTLAYIAQDAALPFQRFESRHIRFESIAVWNNGTRTVFSLSALLDAAAQRVALVAPVALDALALSGVPTELQLFRDGWNDTVKGRFLIDAEGARLCLAAFAEHGVELAMDFDHGTYAASGQKRDVPGYIGALEYRPGDGLYATNIRWTAVGLAAITPGKDEQGNATLPEYRYFSPAIRFDAESRRVTSIEPVALVSWPATKNQSPLVMSARGAVTDQENQMNPQLLLLLGLAVSATENDVLSATMKIAKDRDEALAARAKAEASLKAAEAERDALTKARDEANAKLEASERQSLLDQGRRDGKLTPALETLFAKKNPDEIRAFLAAAPVIEALKPGPKPAADNAALDSTASAQLGAILAKPYEQWTNNDRALVREQSPETFRAKREDAIARGAL